MGKGSTGSTGENIGKKIDSITSIVANAAKSLENLNNTGSSSMDEFSESMHEASEKAEEFSESIHEASEKTEEFSESIKKTKDIRNTSDAMEVVAENAKKMKKNSPNKTFQDMSRSAQDTAKSVERLAKAEEKANKESEKRIRKQGNFVGNKKYNYSAELEYGQTEFTRKKKDDNGNYQAQVDTLTDYSAIEKEVIRNLNEELKVRKELQKYQLNETVDDKQINYLQNMAKAHKDLAYLLRSQLEGYANNPLHEYNNESYQRFQDEYDNTKYNNKQRLLIEQQKELNKAKKEQESLEQKINTMLSEQEQRQDALFKSAKSVRDSLTKSFKNNNSNLVDELDDVTNQIINNNKPLAKNDLDRLEVQLDRVRNEIIEVSNTAKTHRLEDAFVIEKDTALSKLNNLEAELRRTGQYTQQVEDDFNEMRKAINNASLAKEGLKEFNTLFTNFQTKLKGIRDSIKSTEEATKQALRQQELFNKATQMRRGLSESDAKNNPNIVDNLDNITNGIINNNQPLNKFNLDILETQLKDIELEIKNIVNTAKNSRLNDILRIDKDTAYIKLKNLEDELKRTGQYSEEIEADFKLMRKAINDASNEKEGLKEFNALFKNLQTKLKSVTTETKYVETEYKTYISLIKELATATREYNKVATSSKTSPLAIENASFRVKEARTKLSEIDTSAFSDTQMQHAHNLYDLVDAKSLDVLISRYSEQKKLLEQIYNLKIKNLSIKSNSEREINIDKISKLEQKYVSINELLKEIFSQDFDKYNEKLLQKQNKLEEQFSFKESEKQAEEFIKQLDVLKKSLDKVSNSKGKYLSEDLEKASSESKNLNEIIENLKKNATTLFKDHSNINQYSKLIDNLETQIKGLINGFEELAKPTAVTNLKLKMQDALFKNTGFSGNAKMMIGDMIKSLDGMDTTTAKNKLNEIAVAFNKILQEEKAAGRGGTSFFDLVGKKARSFAAQMLMYYTSWMDIIRYFRNGVNAVRELDTVLVDLKKTTTMSNAELEEFYFTANDVAKKMGVTTQEIISQAAAWSRLGYSTKEASTRMAQLSSQFASISPGMGTEEAQTGLVSIMKAWDVDVDDVMRNVMDNINTLGNKFAETNADIIAGMERAGATLSAMGTSIEDSFALFTGAQEVIQNAETVGTALKTLSLRIRGYDEETEELSEDVIKATGKVADLTKVASNNYAGVSLWEDAAQTKYRSLKDYLRDIANIFDEIDAKSQTDLLNNLFGKRGASVGSAILKNFDQVEKAIYEMDNAAGSADREMGIITESIDYKLNNLKQTWIGIAQELIQRDDFGKLVDSLAVVSEKISGIASSKAALSGTIAGLVGASAAARGGGLFNMSLPFNGQQLGFGLNIGTQFKNDIDVLKNALNDYNGYASNSIEATNAFNNEIAKMTLSSQNYVNTMIPMNNGIRNITGSTETYVNALGKHAVQTRLSMLAQTGLNMAINALAGIAIGLAINSIIKLANAEADAAKRVKELTDAYKQDADNIDDYKNRIEELHKKLEDDTLSYEEAKTAREELFKIQSDLIGQYGNETREIGYVTDAINGQIEALEKLKKAKWEKTVDDINNTAWYEDMSWGGSGMQRAKNIFENPVRTYIKELQDSELTKEMFPELFDIDLLKKYIEEMDTYDEFYEDLRKRQEKYSTDSDEYKIFSKVIKGISDDAEKYRYAYEGDLQYNTIEKNPVYQDFFDRAEESYEKYKLAFENGSEEEKETAIRNYQEILAEAERTIEDPNVLEKLNNLHVELTPEINKNKLLDDINDEDYTVDVEVDYGYHTSSSGIEEHRTKKIDGGIKDVINTIIDEAGFEKQEDLLDVASNPESSKHKYYKAIEEIFNQYDISIKDGIKLIEEDLKFFDGTRKDIEDTFVQAGNDFVEAQKKFNEKTSKKGNVDLTNRPKVSSDKMKASGWDVEDGSISTVLTNTFQPEHSYGEIAINATPILPNGERLTPEELQTYIEEISTDATSREDILKRDTKGLVISIHEGQDAGQKAAEEADALHYAQMDFGEFSSDFEAEDKYLWNQVTKDIEEPIKKVEAFEAALSSAKEETKALKDPWDSINRDLGLDFSRDEKTGEIEAIKDDVARWQEVNKQLQEDLHLTDEEFKTMAENAAMATSRFDTAVSDLSSNLKTYKETLKASNGEHDKAIKNSAQYSNTVKKLAADLSGLVDMTVDSNMAEEFVSSKENAELLEKALEGDDTALESVTEKLRIMSAQNIDLGEALNIDVNLQNELQPQWNELVSWLEQHRDLGTISAYSYLDEAPMLNGLYDLYKQGKIKKEQLEALFNGMGWDVKFEPQVIDYIETGSTGYFDREKGEYVHSKIPIIHPGGISLVSRKENTGGNIPSSPPTSGGGGGGGGGGGENSASDSENKTSFDWIERVINNINSAISRLRGNVEDTWLGWKKRNSDLVKEMNKTKKLITQQTIASKRYKQALNRIENGKYAEKVKGASKKNPEWKGKLPAKYKKLVEAEKITKNDLQLLIEKGETSLASQIQAYIDYYEKYKASLDAVTEAQRQLHEELEKQRELINAEYESKSAKNAAKFKLKETAYNGINNLGIPTTEEIDEYYKNMEKADKKELTLREKHTKELEENRREETRNEKKRLKAVKLTNKEISNIESQAQKEADKKFGKKNRDTKKYKKWYKERVKALKKAKKESNYEKGLAEWYESEQYDILSTDIYDARNAEEEQKQKIHYQNLIEMAQAYVDRINEIYENTILLPEHNIAMADKYMALAQANGNLLTGEFYTIQNKNLKKEEQAQIQKNKELKEYIKKLLVEHADEGWTLDTDGVKEFYQDYLQGEEKVIDLQITQAENEEKKIQLAKERYQIEQNYISALQEETSFFKNLISTEHELFDIGTTKNPGTGRFNEYGIATLGLNIAEYETAVGQFEKAKVRLAEAEKAYKADPDNQNRYNDLQEAMQEAYKYANLIESTKKSVQDLYKQQYSQMLKSLQSLINKRKEEIKLQKDSYDYEKKTRDLVKNVTTLRKQLHAYQGDDSEENRARIQKLQVQLKEAEENLEQSEYDKWISDTQNMLDDMYNDFADMYDQMGRDIEARLREGINTTNTQGTNITTTIKEESKKIGLAIASNSPDLKSIFTSGKIAEYYDGKYFTYGNTSIAQWVSIVNSSVKNMTTKLAEELKRDISDTDTELNTPVSEGGFGGVTEQTSKNDTGSGKATGDIEWFKRIFGKAPKTGNNNTMPHGYARTKYGNAKLSTVKDFTNALKNIFQYYGVSNNIKLYLLKMGLKKPNPKNIQQLSGLLTALKAHGFAQGGSVAGTFRNVTGEDGLALVRKGEYVLTPDMLKDALSIVNPLAELAQNKATIGKIGTNITMGDVSFSVNLPNVKNYEEFKTALIADKQFEKVIQQTTLGSALNQNSLKKYSIR